jgi:tripartite-type tricarboxylate transporter receptor subunit TctC
MTKSILAIAAIMGATISVPSMAGAQDFYAGKRLTVLVNYAAGGPADIDARVFARHIGRLIAGQPTVVVQNMDGAGGQVGSNWLGEVAPKDGSVVGLLTGSSFVAAYSAKPSRSDFRTLEFVAAQRSTSVYYARSDVKPGLRQPTDLAKAEGLIIGGLAADSSKDILLRLTLDMLGLRYKYVTSYRGTNAVRLALQQGEVNITSESPPAYRGVVEPGLVKPGIAIPVFYDPEWDGSRFSVPKDVAGLPIPGYQELFTQAKGSLPKGPLWDAYLSIIYLTGSNFRLLAFPPGAPKEAQEAVRLAVAKLASDKEYAEDATKVFGTVPGFDAAPELRERVRKALTTSPEMKAFFAKYIEDAVKGLPQK